MIDTISVAMQERPWSFDGDGDAFKTEATFEWRTLAAARASRKKRRRADSSPRYFSLMTSNVTGHRRSTSTAL